MTIGAFFISFQAGHDQEYYAGIKQPAFKLFKPAAGTGFDIAFAFFCFCFMMIFFCYCYPTSTHSIQERLRGNNVDDGSLINQLAKNEKKRIYFAYPMALGLSGIVYSLLCFDRAGIFKGIKPIKCFLNVGISVVSISLILTLGVIGQRFYGCYQKLFSEEDNGREPENQSDAVTCCLSCFS